MPQRRREREHIDVATLPDVFHYRASLYHLLRDGVLDDFFEGVVERLAKLELVQVSGKAERDVLALAAEDIDEHPMAIGRRGFRRTAPRARLRCAAATRSRALYPHPK